MKPPFWQQAIAELSARDPIMRAIIASYEGETLISRGDVFHTLARSVTGQQISVKAADSIWNRLSARLNGSVTPQNLLSLDTETLRSLGFSRSKITYLHHIAEHFSEPARIAHLSGLSDEELIKELVKLKGVGRWTAEMLLIFHYLRPDILPLDDLGLLKGIYRHYNNGEKLPKEAVIAIAENWRPWRSVATWYMWRVLDPVPVEY